MPGNIEVTYTVMRLGNKIVRGFTVLWLAALATGCRPNPHSLAEPVDEAKAAGRTTSDFPQTDSDLFAGMDEGILLDADEIKGRNTWLTWTAGNQAFWDYLARHGYGLVDLLSILDSRNRSTRFTRMGLINEPGFKKAERPDEYGLWLDQRTAIGRESSNAQVDGRSSGVIGLRLFPNPDFPAARQRWDPERYQNDVVYRNSPDLVRPYRVGMSCAFCHVAFDPLHPPADPENPTLVNLSSTIGNQFWRTTGVFASTLKARQSFVYELLATARPGTVDTSLLATDGNNNPSAINPLFQLGARLARAERNPPEQMLPGSDVRHVPHVLIDGADTIGMTGALLRVYASIGAFHQQWLRDHNLLMGVKAQRPFDVATAHRDSVYWQVTEMRMANLAKFLIKVSQTIPLAKTPGGAELLDEALLTRGKIVFANRCFSCHSSKQPAGGETLTLAQWARAEVLKPDFLKNNYLSTDQRYPVTLIQTNAGRALADNAVRGHVWSDFSSETYKNLPPVGTIVVSDPFDGKTRSFTLPAGGPGYYRVPSLVGIWATAPFLHNNSIGQFSGDPSVAGRLDAFDDAVEKLLWPEKRDRRKSILRTSEKTWLRIPSTALLGLGESMRGGEILTYLRWFAAIPAIFGLFLLVRLRRRLGRVGGLLLMSIALVIFGAGHWLAQPLEFGPIPAGTPINLLANIDPRATDTLGWWKLAWKIRRTLQECRVLNDEEARLHLRDRLGADLLRLSKSPDFIEDRGHLFGTDLPDEDKRALIAFLKTF